MTGRLSRRDAFWSFATRAATTGSKEWEDFSIVYHSALNQGLTDVEMRDLIQQKTGTALPQEILDLSMTFEAKDVGLASSLYWLKHNRLIETDIDVKMRLAATERIKALTGTNPISQLLAEQEEEQADFRRSGLRLLGALFHDPLAAEALRVYKQAFEGRTFSEEISLFTG